MWYKPISREELVDLIERDTDSPVFAYEFRSFSELLVNSSEATAYWKDDPQRTSTIPTGIVVRPERLKDFMAWVATYISLRPFTAYCRVVEPRVIDYFPETQPTSFSRFENCYLGIIFAESLQDLRSPDEVARLSPVECAGTLSFALARSVVLGLKGPALDWIESQWKRAKALTSDRRDFNNTRLILRIFRIVGALGDSETVNEGDQIILRCAQDIVETREIRDHNWFALTAGIPELARALDFQKLPREGRIQLLRRIAEVPWRRNDFPIAAFVIGYLASAVSPGTFDHYRIAWEFETKVSGVLFWYGFCAGLVRKNNLQRFSDGLGRRVVRELERGDSIYARPYCDVAVSELEMLSQSGKAVDFKLGTPSAIEIELAPCVTTVHPVSVERAAARPENVDGLLRELDYKLQDLTRLRGKLAHALRTPEQPSLFTQSGSRKK